MTNIEIRRAELKALSLELKPLVAAGHFANVNQAIKARYAEQGHTDLKTINEWNRLGARIRSGEKALLLWGSEKTRAKDATDKDAEKVTFFPVCYVFSEQQIQNYQPN